jgi:hypothetical protein
MDLTIGSGKNIVHSHLLNAITRFQWVSSIRQTGGEYDYSNLQEKKRDKINTRNVRIDMAEEKDDFERPWV